MVLGAADEIVINLRHWRVLVTRNVAGFSGRPQHQPWFAGLLTAHLPVEARPRLMRSFFIL
jgi:succinate dehydrogenase/fumarate reductase flavoprotein subunit